MSTSNLPHSSSERIAKPRGLKLRGGVWHVDKTVRLGNNKKCQVRQSTGCKDLSLAVKAMNAIIESEKCAFYAVEPFTGDLQDKDITAWAKKLHKIVKDRCQVATCTKEFGLTLNDVKQMLLDSGGRCSVTKIPFDRPGVRKKNPFAPSIDRIDNSKGYTADNCRVVCLLANYAMNVWGEGPLLRVINFAASQQ